MPTDYTVSQLERLLSGIQASCEANGLRYVGGNLREAKAVAGVGTALGSCSRPPLTRRGAQPGDALVVLGAGGRFWADVSLLRDGRTVEKSKSPVFAPISQSEVVHVLHDAGLIRCAMDTSDGLAPSLEELAMVNALSIEVDIGTLWAVSGASAFVGDRPERFWFGWGDWTVVAAVNPNLMLDLQERMGSIGATWTKVGGILWVGFGSYVARRRAAASGVTTGIRAVC